jgi:hypothetical protein
MTRRQIPIKLQYKIHPIEKQIVLPMYPVKVLHSELQNILAKFPVVPLFLLDGLAVAENVCSAICILEYDPVCAGDGVSEPVIFGNSCRFEYYNCANPDKRKFHKTVISS